MAADKFDKAMLDYFQAARGAFSAVTDDEFSKSQVTFTGFERDIVEDILGKKLKDHHGNMDEIKKKGIDPEINYRLFPSGKIVSLTTSYKTNKPRELRYYTKADVYKPKAGDFWGIFEKDGELWLCHFSAKFLQALRSGKLNSPDAQPYIEPEVDDFQEHVNGLFKKSEKTTFAFDRSITVARMALESASFKCELLPGAESFMSRRTGRPYMEAHHLVPMALQTEFDQPLDHGDNVCCLHPLSHRMLHHGNFVDYQDQLVGLVRRRSALLDRLNLIEDDILSIYCKD